MGRGKTVRRWAGSLGDGARVLAALALVAVTVAVITPSTPALPTTNTYAGPAIAVDDWFPTNEDVPLTNLDVLENDDSGCEDSEGVPSVVSFDDAGTDGLVTLNANEFDYDPDGQFEHLPEGFTATDSFTYVMAVDCAPSIGGLPSNGLMSDHDDAIGVVTITVLGVNDPPIAVPDEFFTDPGTPIIGKNLISDPGPGQDFDVDGTDLKVVSVDGDGTKVDTEFLLPSGAVARVDSDGTFTYDPSGITPPLAPGAMLTDTLFYRIMDDQDEPSPNQATVTITVESPPNQPPDAVDDAFQTDEESPFARNLILDDNGLGPDIDPDDDLLLVVAVNTLAISGPVEIEPPEGGRLTVAPDGAIAFYPDGDFEGLKPFQSALIGFEYTIEDPFGESDSAKVSILVWGLEDPTIAVDDAFDVDEDSTVTFDPTANDFDLDLCDEVVVADFSAITDAGGTVTDNLDGTYTYAPPPDFNGPDGFGYEAASVNTCLTGGESGAALPLIRNQFATVNFTVRPQNDPPIARNDFYGTDEDTPLVTPDVRDNDTDIDGDMLVVAPGNPVSIRGVVVINNGDGTFGYAPPPDFHGIDRFQYTALDGNGGSDSAIVTIRVQPVNDPPVGVDDNIATDEDTNVVGNVKAANPFTKDSDVEGDPLTVIELNGVPAHVGVQVILPSGAKLKLNASGVFNYRPNGQFEHLGAGDVAVDTFNYTIGDGNGGTDTATVFVQIQGVNDAPHAVDDQFATNEGTPKGGNVRAENPAVKDSDPDGDPLQVVEVNGAPGDVGVMVVLPSGALLKVQPGGAFLYHPNGQFEGLAVGESDTDSFTYMIADGNGGTDVATVTVELIGTNDPPLAVDDDGAGFGTDEDTSFTTATVLANDTDPDGDSLSVTGLDTAGTAGTVVDNGDGTFDYDPAGQFDFLAPGNATTDTFDYTVSDGNGGFDSAQVTIEIVGVNHAPTDILLSGDTVLENSPPGTVVGDLTAIDPDPGDSHTFIEIADPDSKFAVVGTALVTDGAIDFEVAQLHLVTIRVTDAGGLSYDKQFPINVLNVFEGTGTTTTTTTVTTTTVTTSTTTTAPEATTTTPATAAPANQPPAAVDDAETTAQDTGLVVVVVSNDSDPEGNLDLGSLVVVAGPANGVAVVQPNGSIVYDPDSGFVGDDSFTYRICDDQGACATAVVSVRVAEQEVLAGESCDPRSLAEESFTVTPASGEAGIDVSLDLQVDLGEGDCLPPQILFLFDGGDLAGPVPLSDNPGAVAVGTIPDSTPPGTYLVVAETFTDPPVQVAETPFEVIAVSASGGLPPLGLVVPVGAAGLIIVGAAVRRRRSPDHRHPALAGLPPDDCEDLRANAMDLHDAAIDARDQAEEYERALHDAEARVSEAQAALARCRQAEDADAAGFHLLRHANPNAPDRDDGRRGWFYPASQRTITGIVVHVSQHSSISAAGAAIDRADAFAKAAAPESVHAIADSNGVLTMLPDEYVAIHAPGSDNLTMGLQVCLTGDRAEDDLTLQHAAAWLASKSRTHGIPIRRLTRAQWLGGAQGLIDRRDMETGGEAALPDWPRLLDEAAKAGEENRTVIAAGSASGVVPCAAEQRTFDEAGRDAAALAEQHGVAHQQAVLAEEHAEDVADPWWDCEARVPRHQVPLSPEDEEPNRRRDAYYLLNHENRKASEKADGHRGHYETEREGDIDGIVVHCTETEDAAPTAYHYATSRRPASAHVIADDHGWIKLLPDEYTAYHARNAEDALGLEIAYRADMWGSDPIYEDVLLRMAAAWAAKRVAAYDIPIRKLTTEEWREGERGFLAHEDLDWRRKDPGPDFPWDHFLALVGAMARRRLPG